MNLKFILIFFILFYSWGLADEKKAPETKPAFRAEDRIRVAEAFKIGEKYGDQIWPDWNKAPWALLLVTPDYEYLIRHTNPGKDFKLLEYDSLLQGNIYFRKKTFDIHFLATFPFNGTPTIVVGIPENTGKASSEWIATLLHEHFHQLQYAQPDYYASVDSLNLSGGDKSGMWMLNYPFPYDSVAIDQQFQKLCLLLFVTLSTLGKKEFTGRSQEYWRERENFKNMLSEKDYRYFSFQIWQEGMARYTELKIAELLAQNYQPSQTLSRLGDFLPFKKVAANLKNEIVDNLESMTLKSFQRTAFYPFGAAEGLILDQQNKNWRKLYFQEKFFVEKYSD